MKALLTAIQAQLKTSITYVADADIFVTPDPDIIPVTCGFPAIGLKDGAIERLPETGINWGEVLSVDVIVYQLLTAGAASIMSQTAPAVKGVLDIEADINAALRDNRLAGAESAFPMSSAASETIGYDDIVIVRKIITFIYTKEATA